MSSRHAKKYLQRLQQAQAAQGAGQDLSEAALAFLHSPGARVEAAVFSELLQKGYVQPEGRRWNWTPRAKAVQGRD